MPAGAGNLHLASGGKDVSQLLTDHERNIYVAGHLEVDIVSAGSDAAKPGIGSRLASDGRAWDKARALFKVRFDEVLRAGVPAARMLQVRGLCARYCLLQGR